jgi:hypothetical protein
MYEGDDDDENSSMTGENRRGGHISSSKRSRHHETFGRYYDCDYDNQNEIDRTLFVVGKPADCSLSSFADLLETAMERIPETRTSHHIIVSCCEVRNSPCNKVAIEVKSTESALKLLRLDGKGVGRSSGPLTIARHSKASRQDWDTLFVSLGGIHADEHEICQFLEQKAREVGLIHGKGSPFIHAYFRNGGKFMFLHVRSTYEMKSLLNLNKIRFKEGYLIIAESLGKGKEKESRNTLNFTDFIRRHHAEKEGQASEASPVPQKDNQKNSNVSRKINFEVAPEIKAKYGDWYAITGVSNRHDYSSRDITSAHLGEELSPEERNSSSVSSIGSSPNLEEEMRREPTPSIDTPKTASVSTLHQAEIQQLLDRLHSKDEDLKISQQECNRLREELKGLESKNRDQIEELRQRQQDADDWHDNYNRLDDDFRRKDEDLKDTESRLSNLQEDIRRLREDKARDQEKLSREAKDARESLLKFEDLLKQKQLDISKLEDDMGRLEKERAGARADLEKQQKIADEFRQKYKTLKENKEGEATADKDELSRLREEVRCLERLRLEDVAKERKKTDEYQKKYHDAISACLAADKDYSKIIDELFETKKSLNSMEDKFDIEKERCREAEARVKSLEEASRNQDIQE